VTIRVVVADDQELVRSGFAMIVDAQPDMEVVGEAADGAEAVEAARRTRPDVVLMDVRMPRLDGIEATRQILGSEPPAGGDPPTRVVILTTFDLDEYVFQALRAGASGFLLKDLRREDLLHAVRVVAAGEALLAPSVTRRLIEDLARRPATGPAPRLDGLTPREQEVLELIGRGLNNREIGEALVVGEATVKTHIGRVLMKLQLRDRVQAVIYAYEVGLVGPTAGGPG
jgi:DNA-binding NarL/FixJ family response regulator